MLRPDWIDDRTIDHAGGGDAGSGRSLGGGGGGNNNAGGGGGGGGQLSIDTGGGEDNQEGSGKSLNGKSPNGSSKSLLRAAYAGSPKPTPKGLRTPGGGRLSPFRRTASAMTFKSTWRARDDHKKIYPFLERTHWINACV